MKQGGKCSLGESRVLGSPAEATDAHWAGGREVESGDVPQGDDPGTGH